VLTRRKSYTLSVDKSIQSDVQISKGEFFVKWVQIRDSSNIKWRRLFHNAIALVKSNERLRRS